MRSLQRQRYAIFVTLLVVVGLLAGPAQALMFADERAKFFSNDFVDWATFAPGEDVALVPNGSSTTSNNLGVAVTVANPENKDFLLIDNVNLNFGGSYLLYTAIDGVGPLKITFDRPIFAAGAQIAPNNNVLPHLAMIEAFDSAGISLGFFQRGGFNNPLVPVNFMGVFDPLMSIRSLQFSLELIDGDSFFPGDFFINQLAFLVCPDCPPCPPVPLPGSLLLVGSILAGAVGWRRPHR